MVPQFFVILAVEKTCRGTVVFFQTLKVRGRLHETLFRVVTKMLQEWFLYDIKIYFYLTKINLYSRRKKYIGNVSLLYKFFIQSYSGQYIWSSICIYKSQNFTSSMKIEQQHEGVKNLLRRILNQCDEKVQRKWNASPFPMTNLKYVSHVSKNY